MKWGHVPSSGDPLALLVWALMFAIEDTHHSMAKNIEEMLAPEGEIGGDPGWEIHHFIHDDGIEKFDVWVDPRVSGIEKFKCTYQADVVRKTTREVLDAFADAHPDKRSELDKLLEACGL